MFRSKYKTQSRCRRCREWKDKEEFIRVSPMGRSIKGHLCRKCINLGGISYDSDKVPLRAKARRTMERALGFKLPTFVRVHHKDQDLSNCNLDNLVCTDTKTHDRVHRDINKLIYHGFSNEAIVEIIDAKYLIE